MQRAGNSIGKKSCIHVWDRHSVVQHWSSMTEVPGLIASSQKLAFLGCDIDAWEGEHQACSFPVLSFWVWAQGEEHLWFCHILEWIDIANLSLIRWGLGQGLPYLLGLVGTWKSPGMALTIAFWKQLPVRILCKGVQGWWKSFANARKAQLAISVREQGKVENHQKLLGKWEPV